MKCDYCGNDIRYGELIILEHMVVLAKEKLSISDFEFCSKKCLMSFISGKCREIGIRSEEEKIWDEVNKK